MNIYNNLNLINDTKKKRIFYSNHKQILHNWYNMRMLFDLVIRRL